MPLSIKFSCTVVCQITADKDRQALKGYFFRPGLISTTIGHVFFALLLYQMVVYSIGDGFKATICANYT